MKKCGIIGKKEKIMRGEQMRLFVAVELTKAMRYELYRMEEQLKQMSFGGRFSPMENLHITLHFIGETSDLAGAVKAVTEGARCIRPFELQLGEYSSFEKNGSRLSHCTVKGDLEELCRLYESIQCAMSDFGFPRERKRFVPHITLGRSVVHDELVDAEMKKFKVTTGMRVSGITLFESRREKNGMVYIPLHREKFE